MGAPWKDLAWFFVFCFVSVFEDLVSLQHLMSSLRVT